MFVLGKVAIFLGVIVAACVRPTRGAFGIPDFLEFGECFNATLVDGFDPVKYQGLWFSIQSVPNEYEHSRRCNSMNYTWHGDRMISVGRGLTDEGVKIRQVTELLEELELREPPHPAYMTVIAEGVPESPYEIISTDYVTYSCVHSCLEYFGFKAEFFWVFGRTPYLSRDYVDHCHEAFTSMGVDPSRLLDIPHGEFCPYSKRLKGNMEKNRQLMIRLGVMNEDDPLLPSIPPPTVNIPTVLEEDIDQEFVSARGDMPPSHESPDGTTLEASESIGQSGSSAPLKTNNIAIPLFVLVAVLLPAIAR